MLKMDEKTLLKEAKDINLEKVQQAIKQVSHETEDIVIKLPDTFLGIHLSTCYKFNLISILFCFFLSFSISCVRME